MIFCLLLIAVSNEPLGPGNHLRSLKCDDLVRSYGVHIPPQYDSKKPTPVVLLFHGAGMNARIMAGFCGMNQTADREGFIAVYPNGTGVGPLLTYNAGGWTAAIEKRKPNDVKFVASLLDDLTLVVNVDKRRVYAAGMSNGAMMCYRLAAELSERIAAIAAVAGTMAIIDAKPKRPVPVIHFHGLADKIVPYDGASKKLPQFLTFKSVDDTLRIWCEINGCGGEPKSQAAPDKVDDGTTVRQKTFGSGKNGAEVVLFQIEGGGHTWPGRRPRVPFVGPSTKDILANDLIWEFFKKHPMKKSK